MAVFENYPYTNLHNLNLDFMFKKLKELGVDLDDFKNLTTTQIAALRELIEESIINYPTRMILVGDSYSQGWNPDAAGDGWSIVLARDLLQLDPADYEILHIGGCGFAHVGNNKTFTTLLADATIKNPETITDIVVAGGYNDIYETTSAISSGIAAFCTAARSIYPNAKIHIGFIGRTAQNGNGSFDPAAEIGRVLAAYIRGAVDNDALYMNGVENSSLPEYLASDFYHLTVAGYRQIAKAMYQVLKSGSFTIHAEYTGAITADTGITCDGAFQVMVNNDTVTFNFATASIAFTAARTIAANTEYQIGTFNKRMFGAIPYTKPIEFPINPVLRYTENGSTKYIDVPGWIRFRNNVMSIYFMAVNDTHSNYLSVPNVVSMQVSPRHNITISLNS